jgi:hypothetical protein
MSTGLTGEDKPSGCTFVFVRVLSSSPSLLKAQAAGARALSKTALKGPLSFAKAS